MRKAPVAALQLSIRTGRPEIQRWTAPFYCECFLSAFTRNKCIKYLRAQFG